MNIVIRRLSPQDSLSELTALLHEAYAPLGALGLNYTALDQTEDVTRERIAGGECYLACDGAVMAGTILFRQAKDARGCRHYDKPTVAAIHQFGVRPAYQRKGVGRQLLMFAENRARETGAAEVALDTAESAHHLVAWYTRLGYRVVETVRWDGKAYRSVIMSKWLAE